MTKHLLRNSVGIGLACVATAAVAATYSYTDGGPNDGKEGSTYWTIFAINASQQSLKVNNSDTRDITMKWAVGKGGDYVAGGGWGNQGPPKTVTYKMHQWTGIKGSGTFGMYGWSCDTPEGQDNVEFYVVDAWFGGDPSKFTPYQGTYKETVKTTGGDYRIYYAPAPAPGTRCPGKPFHQVWAVRTTKRGVPAGQEATIQFGTLQPKMAKYGYFSPRFVYLVVGAEGYENSAGTIRVSSRRN